MIMYKILIVLSIIVLLSGCVENSNTNKTTQENVIIDYTNSVQEVCINNVVYYRLVTKGTVTLKLY